MICDRYNSVQNRGNALFLTIALTIKTLGVAELRYDRTTVPGSSGRIAFKSEYLNDYLNMEWERPKN